MSARSSSAVAAAVAVAADLGHRGVEPVVLREAWHVLVHLRPLPVVARVSGPPGPEVDTGQVRRELAIAGHAASGGAPVIPPADVLDPGPHERDGHILTFFRFVEPRGEVEPPAAGRGLRVIHEVLADFDEQLPDAGHPGETARMLDGLTPSPDVELLHCAFASRPPVGGQAVHGDAHLANCLATGGRPLWHDFEKACRAAPEYDLAALVFRDRLGHGDRAARAALAAYGEHDEAAVEGWLPIYAAWVLASMLTVLPRRPELAQIVRERLDALSACLGAARPKRG
jgi:Phosphotransferase enzyme family